VSEHQPTPYAQSLSFLVSQVGARSAQIFAERLAPLGVSPRAFGVLSNLSSTGGQSQQQLADTLGIHRNNMVGLIDELEAAGWVRRHRSHRDRRAFDVRLTRSGSALVSRINNLIPVLDAEVGQGLTDSEQQAMVELLQRMASTLALRPGIHPGLSGPSRAIPHPKTAGMPDSLASNLIAHRCRERARTRDRAVRAVGSATGVAVTRAYAAGRTGP
jgi:DNA-binding MarR family transcriptional regulator